MHIMHMIDMRRVHRVLAPLYCYLVIAMAASIVYFALNLVIPLVVPTNFPASGDITNAGGVFIGALSCFCSLLFPLHHQHSATSISRHVRTIRRWGPLLLGLVLLFHTVGQILIVFDSLGHVVTSPTWSDAFFLGEYPLLLLVLFMLPTRSISKAASLRAILDSLIILISLLLFMWHFFLGPLMIQPHHTLLQNLVGIAYPSGNLILLCYFLLLSARSTDAGLRTGKWLLLGGLIFLVIGDIENEYALLMNTLSYSFIQTIAWSIAYAVLGLSTYFLRFAGITHYATGKPTAHEQAKIDRSLTGLSPFWLSLLPYALIPATLLLFFSSLRSSAQGPIQNVVYGGVAALYILILVRQVFSLGETRKYAHQLYRANERLSSLATTDPLTSLPNHRALATALTQELARTQRSGQNCSLLFLDLDHFKALNDGYGHAAGDVVLTIFADLILASIRAGDSVGRWGGEEFLVLLPETNIEDALTIAERIRSTVSQHAFEIGGGLHLTCSIGAACYAGYAQSQQELVHAADQAMYGAKRLGRNQVRAIADPAVQALIEGGTSEEDREEAALRGTVQALALLVEKRGASSGHHTQQVADLVYDLALALHIPASQAYMLALAGQLHDIGKVAIPDALLRRPGPLTPDEWKQMQTSPAVGAEVISYIPSLRPLAPIIHAQRERWDGRGYPDQLARYAIPLGARLLAVADAYVVMINERPYQAARSSADALIELQRCAGSQFDPEIVEVLPGLLRHKQEQKIAELAHSS